MPLDYERVLNWQFDDVEQSYSTKEAILYALSIGFGADPTNPNQLRYVYESGLTTVPSMATTLGYPGFWLSDPATGVTWQKMLHGEQGLILHRPLPAAGHVVGRTKVDRILDKGPDSGAIIYTNRDLLEAGSRELIASQTASFFCRADGGFGGPSGPVSVPHGIPQRDPDLVHEIAALPQAALLYRLNGDLNPIHVDPEVAHSAGFERPILHGLCTFGIACHALLATLCDYDANRLKSMQVRFSRPVFPGEVIRTEVWNEGPGRAAFRSNVPARDLIVLNNGCCEFGDRTE